jgi:hypothetical protein
VWPRGVHGAERLPFADEQLGKARERDLITRCARRRIHTFLIWHEAWPIDSCPATFLIWQSGERLTGDDFGPPALCCELSAGDVRYIP